MAIEQRCCSDKADLCCRANVGLNGFGGVVSQDGTSVECVHWAWGIWSGIATGFGQFKPLKIGKGAQMGHTRARGDFTATQGRLNDKVV